MSSSATHTAHEPRQLGVGMHHIAADAAGCPREIQGLVRKQLSSPTLQQLPRQQRHLLTASLCRQASMTQATALASLSTRRPNQTAPPSADPAAAFHPLPPEIQNGVPLLMQLVRHRQLIAEQPFATVGTEQGRINQRKVSNRCRL